MFSDYVTGMGELDRCPCLSTPLPRKVAMKSTRGFSIRLPTIPSRNACQLQCYGVSFLACNAAGAYLCLNSKDRSPATCRVMVFSTSSKFR